jgi:hypothetical protein
MNLARLLHIGARAGLVAAEEAGRRGVGTPKKGRARRKKGCTPCEAMDRKARARKFVKSTR